MDRNRIRVLLIEDEETDYLLTRRMLSSIDGYTFDLEWASSWQMGIEAIRRCAHDVCLLDFRIGGGDGLELLKESRNAGCLAPVILLTGVSDHRLDVEAMNLGAADYLVKDKLSSELLERSMRYCIGRAETIRELQRHQDELRASELRYRSVVQSANEAIILADDNGRIIAWNKGAETIFGYTEAEILGSPLEVLMPESYREPHRAGLERFRVTGRSHIIGRCVELEGLRKDGAVFPLDLSLATWTNSEGTLFTGIIRDVTERKRNDELQRARDAAEEANRAKSSFMARMSHELRTPLHAIMGFTNLMLRNRGGNLNSEDLGLLQRILLNAKSQLRVVNGVLDLSRVEAGQPEVQLGETAIDGLVREVVNRFEGEGRNPNVALVLRLPSTVRPIQADSDKLKQVLINLVGNALKFTEQGTVTVAVVVSPIDFQPVRIDVTDTGSGILPERFLCRSLCDLMGFELSVTSEPGRGATFSVVLSQVTQLPLSA